MAIAAADVRWRPKIAGDARWRPENAIDARWRLEVANDARWRQACIELMRHAIRWDSGQLRTCPRWEGLQEPLPSAAAGLQAPTATGRGNQEKGLYRDKKLKTSGCVKVL